MFIDEQVMAATAVVNTARKQDYNQVVLVGDGFDTRPFRLPWPAGTVIYMVAPGRGAVAFAILYFVWSVPLKQQTPIDFLAAFITCALRCVQAKSTRLPTQP